MKSEERHKLQTNYLAEHTGQAINTVKPMATWIVGGLIAVLLGIFGYAFFKGQSDKKNAEAWTLFYFDKDDSESLIQVYEDYPSSPAAQWAQQAEADSKLGEATNSWYFDREQANKLCEEAITGYKAVFENSRDTLLRSRATLGLAQAYETLGDRDQAIENYKKVQTMDGTVPELAKDIEKRLTFLDSSSGQEFFAWYKDYVVSETKETLGIPGNLNTLPESPDIEMPPSIGPVPSPSSETSSTLELPPASTSEGVPASTSPGLENETPANSEVLSLGSEGGAVETDSTESTSSGSEGESTPTAEGTSETPPSETPTGEVPTGETPPSGEPAGNGGN